MKTFMASVRERYAVGLVGGSDLLKILEQMGGKDGEIVRRSKKEIKRNNEKVHSSAIHSYDYVFAENGLVAYKDGELVAVEVQYTYLG